MVIAASMAFVCRPVAVVIATGAQYRRLQLDNLSKFEGAGVYYGATFVEARLCDGEDVIVLGGGNSSGQAAVSLAQTARRVHLIVRARGRLLFETSLPGAFALDDVRSGNVKRVVLAVGEGSIAVSMVH